jgi:hypothetical protein
LASNHVTVGQATTYIMYINWCTFLVENSFLPINPVQQSYQPNQPLP